MRLLQERKDAYGIIGLIGEKQALDLVFIIYHSARSKGAIMGLFGKAEPEKIKIDNIELHCEICKNDTFLKREAQLNTAVATFFNFDWANRVANCYVCSNCGYVHWFLPQ